MSKRKYTKSKDGVYRTDVTAQCRLTVEEFRTLEMMASKSDESLKCYMYGLLSSAVHCILRNDGATEGHDCNYS